MIVGVDKICWKMCFFTEPWRVKHWIGRSGLVSARGDNSIPHENLNAELEDKKLWTSETIHQTSLDFDLHLFF